MKTCAEETAEIKRLESIDCSSMTKREADIHWQKIKDAYWRRGRAREREAGIPENELTVLPHSAF